MATTVGVIIFIMVLALIDASSRVSPDEIKARAERIAAEIDDVTRQEADWNDRTQAELDRAEGYAGDVRTREKAAADALNQNEEDQQRLRGVLRGMDQKIGELAQALDDLEKAVASIEAQPPVPEEGTKIVKFRVPRLRPTKKEAIVFECYEGKIYVLAADGRLNEANYSLHGIGNVGVVSRREDARGETFEEALRKGSRFRRAFGHMKRSTHYADFLVRADSFEAFRRVREALWGRGCDINWRAFAMDETFMVGSGAAADTVQ